DIIEERHFAECEVRLFERLTVNRQRDESLFRKANKKDLEGFLGKSLIQLFGYGKKVPDETVMEGKILLAQLTINEESNMDFGDYESCFYAAPKEILADEDPKDWSTVVGDW